jgi:hypothetical protein
MYEIAIVQVAPAVSMQRTACSDGAKSYANCSVATIGYKLAGQFEDKDQTKCAPDKSEDLK